MPGLIIKFEQKKEDMRMMTIKAITFRKDGFYG